MTAPELVTLYGASSVPLPEEALRFLDDPGFREEVLREIHQSSIQAAGVLRTILEKEVSCRGSHSAGDYFENLYWCGFLLWRVGDLADVLPLWRAKNTDFDTGCCFDVQFLVGAGLDETIRYLRTCPDSEARAVLTYIEQCRDARDFEGMQEWAEWRSRYFLP